ncbi:MAG: hypothetical protein PHQ35_11420 [Phycisphaerae bacterium]|nr:hypothetical protein [Phycisphaerae bacterium]
MKEEWKKIKEVVDSIFEHTKDARETMRRHYDMYLGKIWDESTLESWDSKVFYNNIFALVQAQAPLLTDNNPIPTVVPRFGFLERVATAYTRGVSYLWDALEMQDKILKGLIYSMVKKIGIFKIYFDPAKSFGGELCCDLVDPVEFFIAPGYDDEWKAPFCGVKSVKPLSWIRANFPDVKEIKADTSIFEEKDKANAFKYQEASEFELDVRFATVYEFFERNTSYKEDFAIYADEDREDQEMGRYVYFTQDQFLGEKKATDKHGLPPYVTLRDYIDPSGFLGIDEVDMTESLIKEENLMLQAIAEYARKHLSPNYEFDVTQYADKDDIQERIHKGGQVFSKSGAASDKPLLAAVEEPPLNATVINLFRIIPDMLEELSGITDVTKGEASKKQRQSASEIAILLESSHTRIRQKVRNLEMCIKRICILFVKLMQQYYTEPRNIYTKNDEGFVYSKLSNTANFAKEAIASPQSVAKGKMKETGDLKANEITPDEQDEYEDYKQFVDLFGGEDEIYFDFDIQIDTNSTLPLDKQTLSNMFIRLAQMQLVDREAVLSTLNVPKWKQIVARMDQKEDMQKQAKGPIQANPENPQDVQEFQSLMQGGAQ